MQITDLNVWRLLAEDYIGSVPKEEWAIRCLELGYDSPSLRILASMLPTDWPSVVQEKRDKAIRELGWDKIPKSVFLLEYARLIAEDILADRISTDAGSVIMCRILSDVNGDPELGAWYSIEESLWSQAYYEKTGKKDEYFYIEPDTLVALIKKACTNLLNHTKNRFGELAQTSFDEAVGIFKQFLTDNATPTDIVWLFAEDVESIDLVVSLRDLDVEQNRNLVRDLYEYGKERGFGIEMKAFATQNSQVFAYIVIPENELDAEYRLMSADFVKFSCLKPLFAVSESEKGLSTIVKKLISKRKEPTLYGNPLPSREELKLKVYRRLPIPT